MSEYKLSYFNIKGFGEPIRLILSYLGKDFEDNRVNKDAWLSLKKSTPFGKLPILEMDGMVLHQSTAICRYLAKDGGLAGTNNWENLQIDQIVGDIGDLVLEISRFHKAQDPSEMEQIKETLINESVPFYFKKIEEILKDNNGYLANGRLSWADFYFVGFIETVLKLLDINISQYPSINNLKETLYALPGVKEWVKKRPDTV